MTNQPMTGWQKMAAGRKALREKMPYFETALFMLAPIDAPGLGTIGVTENGILTVDTKWFATLTTEQAAGALLHELGHVLRKSAERTRQLVGFDCRLIPPHQLTIDQRVALQRSNIAADMAINPDVRDAGFVLPTFKHPDGTESNGCWPKDRGWAEGLLHEEYYRMLEDDAEETKRLTKLAEAAAAAAAQGSEQAQGGCSHGQCGSGGGMPQPNEPAADNPAGRTQAEMDQTRRQTAEAIHAHAAKGRGSVPGGWERWAGDVCKPPQVPWNRKFQRAVRNGIAQTAGAVDLRYDGISRRQAAVGDGPGAPILPRYRAPKPRVLFLIDTSGSMGDDDLENAVTEANGVIRAVGGEIEFASIDAEIHTTGKARSWRDIKLTGGGGTVFTPAFDYLASLPRQLRPSVVVFATDGDAYGIPEVPPQDIKFIWLLTREDCELPSNVTWGEVIKIN